MSSISTFANSGEHYVKSYNVYQRKSKQTMKILEALRDRIPTLVQGALRQKRSSFNVLSVGSGPGEMDIGIIEIIKQELMKSEHGRHVKIFNQAIEPNEETCGRYKAAIVNLPNSLDDRLTEFELCQQTFQEYMKSQKEPVKKFDMVHFIHSLYYVDIEQCFLRCFERELNDGGAVVCVIDGTLMGEDLMYWVPCTESHFRHKKKKDETKYINERAEQVIAIANKNGWKYEMYTQEYSIDVTEILDEKSTEGNFLLDFLTHTLKFRETSKKQLVEETLQLIKNKTTVKDGKRLGEKSESILVIYK